MTSWQEILDAVGESQGGDRGRAREELLDCWDRVDEPGAAQRCVIAHYLADLQDDVDDEVAWDERALAAFGDVADGDLAVIGIASAAGFIPSLHLNLGDGYLRQGRVQDARHHVAEGRKHASTLPEDGYGAMIRRGLSGLSTRVAQAEATRDEGVRRSAAPDHEPG